VPDSLKALVAAKAEELINGYLKPAHIETPPKKPQFNYITDIYSKWYQSYFYFCAEYACPFPDAISPSFETRFARMGYRGESDRFNLAYMRHTGQWWVIYHDLSLDECLTTIREEIHFQP
jgi:hypothetical protein